MNEPKDADKQGAEDLTPSGPLSWADQRSLRRLIPRKCCVNCRHWDELEWPDWDGMQLVLYKNSWFLSLTKLVSWFGWCRRNPPQRYLEDTVWPCTDYDDWCGEFQPREGGRADE